MIIKGKEIVLHQLFFPYGMEAFEKEIVIRLFVDNKRCRIVLNGADMDLMKMLKAIFDEGKPVQNITIDSDKVKEISYP